MATDRLMRQARPSGRVFGGRKTTAVQYSFSAKPPFKLGHIEFKSKVDYLLNSAQPKPTGAYTQKLMATVNA